MTEEKPLVSIGMPVYNGEKYIRQALDSLLAQDYEHFELIISDNASTDGTGEICREYVARDGRISYYRNEKNMGGTWNFRRVLTLASGGYFMWAAHDDLWEASFISSTITAFISNQTLVFVGTDFDIVNYVTGEVRQYPIASLHMMNSVFKNCVELLRKPTPNYIYGLFRTDILRSSGFVNNNYFDFGDLYLMSKVALIGGVHTIPSILFHAGVTEAIRHPKSFARHRIPGFKFDYFRYYISSVQCFITAESLTRSEKLQLLQLLNEQVWALVNWHEKTSLHPRVISIGNIILWYLNLGLRRLELTQS